MAARRLVLIAVVAVVFVGLAGTAVLAHCGNCPGDKPKVTTLSGEVKSVNAESRELVLSVASGESTRDVALKVCPKAKILVDGKEATLADVKAGVKAKVCHTKTDSGDLVAVRIAVGG